MNISELNQLWLSSVCMTVAPHTYKDYKNTVMHINHYIGMIDVDSLSSYDVKSMLQRILDEFNAQTVSHIYSVFRIIIHFAIDNDFIIKNVLKGIKLPKKHIYTPTILSEGELSRLLRCSLSYDLYPAILLAGCLGLRRGEVLGLKFSDVDPIESTITISRSVEWHEGSRVVSGLKSSSSYRILLVSRNILNQLLMLRHESEYFINYSQSSLQRKFAKCLAENDFPSMRFHDLRHTYASIAVKRGVNFKVLQNRLGHSSIRITLDLYSHLDITSQKDSVSLFDDLI